MEQTKLFYRRWESKYSPHNRAVREAQAVAASDRTHAKREQRAAELQAAREAFMADPVTRARREAASASAVSIASLMPAPRRHTPIPSRACTA